MRTTSKRPPESGAEGAAPAAGVSPGSAGRAGIARQIHDEAGRLLAALAMDLEGLGAATRRGVPHGLLDGRVMALVRQVDPVGGSRTAADSGVGFRAAGASRRHRVQANQFQVRRGPRTAGLERKAALDGEQSEAVCRIVTEGPLSCCQAHRRRPRRAVPESRRRERAQELREPSRADRRTSAGSRSASHITFETEYLRCRKY